MISHKFYAGYVITLTDSSKFAVCKDGGNEYPWNVYEWDDARNDADWCSAIWGAYKTKREAIDQLKLVELYNRY